MSRPGPRLAEATEAPEGVHLDDAWRAIQAARASRLNACTYVAPHPRVQTPADGAAPGALAGVPFAVKDVIDVAGVPTTMASRVPARPVPERDAPVVARLLAAGAAFVGKTNATEFSMGIRGDVSAAGPAVHPLDPSRLTGGSSSGSAVAVAAGIVPIALGSDTAGSVRLPAALCGVVGFKPTLGALPTEGVFPLSESFDTLGVLATSVDAAAASWSVVGAVPVADVPVGRVVRLEVPAADAVVTDVARAAQRLDAPTSQWPSGRCGLDELAELYEIVRSYEAWRLHAPLVAAHASLYQPSILGRLREAARTTAEDYARAVAQVEQARAQALEVFGNADVFVMPTAARVAPPRDEIGSQIDADLKGLTVPWNVLGWPAISVPTGPLDGPLPGAVQLIARPGCEDVLLATARLLEQRTGGAPS